MCVLFDFFLTLDFLILSQVCQSDFLFFPPYSFLLSTPIQKRGRRHSKICIFHVVRCNYRFYKCLNSAVLIVARLTVKLNPRTDKHSQYCLCSGDKFLKKAVGLSSETTSL